jgi:hypothetical protein
MGARLVFGCMPAHTNQVTHLLVRVRLDHKGLAIDAAHKVEIALVRLYHLAVMHGGGDIQRHARRPLKPLHLRGAGCKSQWQVMVLHVTVLA